MVSFYMITFTEVTAQPARSTLHQKLREGGGRAIGLLSINKYCLFCQLFGEVKPTSAAAACRSAVLKDEHTHRNQCSWL